MFILKFATFEKKFQAFGFHNFVVSSVHGTVFSVVLNARGADSSFLTKAKFRYFYFLLNLSILKCPLVVTAFFFCKS